YCLYIPLISLILIIPRPPISTLFPYTTLFRSRLREPEHRPVRQPREQRRRSNAAPPRVPRRHPLPGAPRRGSADSRPPGRRRPRSEEHTSELQSRFDLVCRLLLEKKKKKK